MIVLNKNKMDCSNYENCSNPVEIKIREAENYIDLLMVGCWGVYCDQGVYQIFKKGKSHTVIRNQKKVFEALKHYVSHNNVKDMFLAGDNVYKIGLKQSKPESSKEVASKEVASKEVEEENKLKTEFLKKYANLPDDAMYDISLQLSEGFKNCFALSGISRFFIAIGNHDIENCEILNTQINYESKLWNMPSTYYNVLYSLKDNTTINVIVIDTNMYEKEPLMCTGKPFPQEFIDKQEAWVKSQKGKADWTIVVGHIPYLANGHIKDKTKEKTPKIYNKALENLINLASPQLYFCADEHNQQFIFDKNNNRSLVIAGSGGTDLDDLVEQRIDGTQYAKKTPGFVSIKIQKENLEITFYSTGTRIEFNVSIDKNGSII